MSPMTSKIVLHLFLLCTVVALSFSERPLLAADPSVQPMQTTTEFSYRPGPGDTPAIARTLALYGAKYEAVLWLAGQLAGKGLLKDYANRQMEIFCLVADELQCTIVNQSFSKNKGVYTIKIKSRVSLADFVKAEIKNAALEKEEMDFSLQEELEPVVSPALDPGQELSRAYRYLRNQQWRKAIIYLDQLEKKYPYWGDLFFAKALGFEAMHETQQAIGAFSTACERGNQEACKKARAEASGD
jgi:tetratricopeptide (TPR) repeat protein